MEAISTRVLLRWIASCRTEEHLKVADKAVTLFNNMYGATTNYTRLCMELQMARIQVNTLNAISQ